MANQDEDVDKMVRDGYLFVVLYCSTAGKGHRFRLSRRAHSTIANANANAA